MSALGRLRAFLRPGLQSAEGAATPEEARLAACVLLLDVGYEDDALRRDERDHLRRFVGYHFGMRSDDADALIAIAEDRRRTDADLASFDNVVREHYSRGQRTLLAEAMCRLIPLRGRLKEAGERKYARIFRRLGAKEGYLSRRAARPMSKPETRSR